jgi:Tfp pilus assembly protein PilO
MNRVRSVRGLSAEARKGIAVLAVAALAVLAFGYLILAWQSQEAERLRQAQAENDMVVARTAKAVRDGATRLTAADNVAPMFLDGATPGLAFAKFQSIAGDAATAAGLEVKRMQPADTGDGEGAAPYRLSLDLEGSIDQLRDFLVDVESRLPLMFVTGLEVQPAAGEGEGEADPYPSESLRMTLRIEAYGWRAQP